MATNWIIDASRGLVTGAVGDGVADDTAACQAVLDAIPGEGGEVRFNSGVYKITSALRPKSGTRIVGEGAKLMCAAAGWALQSTTNFGLINIDNKDRVSVTGMYLYGTKTADISNTPKLIYIEDSTNVNIHHNTLENTAFEGIWQGGSASATRQIAVCGNLLKNVGYPAGAYVGLPAIQMNAYDAVINDNILVDVGVGIGASGAGTVVSGNKITGVQTVGIGIGDGALSKAIVISGNSVEIGAFADRPAVGIQLDSGVDGSCLVNVCGNIIRVVGNAAYSSISYGIRQLTALHCAISKNTIEIENKGSGVEVRGSSGGSYAFLSGNVVRVMNEAAQCFGIVGIPGGAGQSLTVASDNNRVYGMITDFNSYAFDFNNNGGGTLSVVHMNDLKIVGYVRTVGGTFYSNLDFAPINISV